jgi:AcrR family transcriptional regulator
MAREEVARNQRARLYGGMIESVSQRGYQGTTVAHVIALAGVSRRAFYELFANKEACFLATYDIVIARTHKRMRDAWCEERGWANRMRSATKTLLDDIAESPKGPRLVLVDALGIGPSARERMQLAAFTFERLVTGASQVAPDGVGFARLTSRGIVGGVRQIIFRRLLEGRERELYTLTDEVLDWAEAYRSPAAARLSVLRSVASRQPPSPAAFLQREDHRTRALGAIVQLTLDEGYAPLTDPQIAQFADMSTEAFHEQFTNKEACLLTVLDEFAAEAIDAVTPSFESGPTWPDAVHRAMVAFVDYLVAHQALLQIAFIDVFEVGPAIIGRISRVVELFTELLTEDAPAPRRGSEIAVEAITGAIWATVAGYASSTRVSQLPRLVEHLTFTVLAPYVGPKAAVEEITATRGPLRSV